MNVLMRSVFYVADSSVSIVTRIRLYIGFDSRQEHGFFPLHHRVQTCSRAHPASYAVGTGGFFLGVGRPEHELDRSLPSGVEAKKA